MPKKPNQKPQNKNRDALRAIAESPETETADPTPPPQPEAEEDTDLGRDTTLKTLEQDTPETSEQETEPAPPEKTPEEQMRIDVDALVQACTQFVNRLLTLEEAVRQLHSQQKLSENMFIMLTQHVMSQQHMPGMSPMTGVASPHSQFNTSPPPEDQAPPPPTPLYPPEPASPPPAPELDPPPPPVRSQAPPTPIRAEHPGQPDFNPQPHDPNWIPVNHNPSVPGRPPGCGKPAYFLTRVFEAGEPADIAAMRIRPPGEAAWRAPAAQGEAPVCSSCGVPIHPWSSTDLDFSVLRAYQERQMPTPPPAPRAPVAQQSWSPGIPGHTPEANADVLQGIAHLGGQVFPQGPVRSTPRSR